MKNADVYSYLVSEEIGELKLGKGTKRSINLLQELRRTDLTEEKTPKFIFLIDPVDGTNNAIKEIFDFMIRAVDFFYAKITYFLLRELLKREIIYPP